MAITETRPPTESTADEAEPERFIGLPDHEQSGLAGFLGTGDHLSLGSGLHRGLAPVRGGRAGRRCRALHGRSGADHFRRSPSTSSRCTRRAASRSVLRSFAIPLFVGLATCITPAAGGRQHGGLPPGRGHGVLGMAASGPGLVVAAYAIDGGPAGGRAKAVDLSYAGLALVLASLLVASVCVVTTVVALRTPGLWLDRVPMFSWSMVVAGTVWLLTLPVLLANILLVYIDHHYGQPVAVRHRVQPVAPALLGLRPAADLRRRHPRARHRQRRRGHAVGRPPDAPQRHDGDDRRVRDPHASGRSPSRPSTPTCYNEALFIVMSVLDHPPGAGRASAAGRPRLRAGRPLPEEPAALRARRRPRDRWWPRWPAALFTIKAAATCTTPRRWPSTASRPPVRRRPLPARGLGRDAGRARRRPVLVPRRSSGASPTTGWPSWPPWWGWSAGSWPASRCSSTASRSSPRRWPNSAHFLNGTSRCSAPLLVAVAVVLVVVAAADGPPRRRRRRLGRRADPRVVGGQPAAGRWLRSRSSGSSRPSRCSTGPMPQRGRADGGELMAVTIVDESAGPLAIGDAPPPPVTRPRVLLVGTVFASAASVMLIFGLLGVYLHQRAIGSPARRHLAAPGRAHPADPAQRDAVHAAHVVGHRAVGGVRHQGRRPPPRLPGHRRVAAAGLRLPEPGGLPLHADGPGRARQPAVGADLHDHRRPAGHDDRGHDLRGAHGLPCARGAVHEPPARRHLGRGHLLAHVRRRLRCSSGTRST